MKFILCMSIWITSCILQFKVLKLEDDILLMLYGLVTGCVILFSYYLWDEYTEDKSW